MIRRLLLLLFHDEANIGKLLTRDDPYNLHKSLGTLSVCSFILRYLVFYNTKGTLGVEGTTFDWLTMLAHTSLAFSSIIFKVPSKRIDSKPMVIYEEYRQHAMVSTFRSFSVYALATLYPQAPSYVTPLVVACHHLLVDYITSKHGSGNTAVRANSKKLETSQFYKHVGKLYSFYQFLAIGSFLLPNERMGDMAFNANIAIQSSAFMMTLYRKRIIRGRTHMAVYSFCLLLSGFHYIRLIGVAATVLIAAAFLVRINISISKQWDKYIVWTGFVLVATAFPPSELAVFGRTDSWLTSLK